MKKKILIWVVCGVLFGFGAGIILASWGSQSSGVIEFFIASQMYIGETGWQQFTKERAMEVGVFFILSSILPSAFLLEVRAKKPEYIND